MDQSNNPYAPSRASLGSGTAQVDDSRVWRLDKKILIMAPDSELPDRCVKCNEPADEPTKPRKVYWHHPGYYAVLLINVILYAIVALIARKTATVNPGLCARHKQRRARGIMLAWGSIVLGVMAMFALAGTEYAVFAALLPLVILICIIAGMIMSRIVYAKRIDDKYVQLKGCGEPFLAELPDFRPSARDLI